MNDTCNTPITLSPKAGDIIGKATAATAVTVAKTTLDDMSLSDGQRDELQRFKRMFPTEKSLTTFFAPAKWAAALEKKKKCLDFCMVTLSVLRLFYSDDIASQMVKNNLVGLYTVAKPNEVVNERAVNLAADLFVGKFGHELSVFGMLYYFASYLTTYRNTYASFDLQDVLRQCDQKFLPRWRSSVHRNRRSQPQLEKAEETGRAALFTYLRREYVAKGRDIRESNIYQTGAMEEKDIALIESLEPLPF